MPVSGRGAASPAGPVARQPPWHAWAGSPIRPPARRLPHPGIPGPRGPAGQAPPDPYRTEACTTHAPSVQAPLGNAPRIPCPCRGEALPRPPRHPARQTPRGAHPRGRSSPRPGAHHPTTRFPALTGRRVRHRLTPTGRGSHTTDACSHRPHRGRSAPTCVGARRCLARPRRMARGMPWHMSAGGDGHGRWPTGPGGGLPALRAGWVRQRLTPTNGGSASR